MPWLLYQTVVHVLVVVDLFSSLMTDFWGFDDNILQSVSEIKNKKELCMLCKII